VIDSSWVFHFSLNLIITEIADETKGNSVISAETIYLVLLLIFNLLLYQREKHKQREKHRWVQPSFSLPCLSSREKGTSTGKPGRSTGGPAPLLFKSFFHPSLKHLFTPEWLLKPYAHRFGHL
jgi:hypothetical protein